MPKKKSARSKSPASGKFPRNREWSKPRRGKFKTDRHRCQLRGKQGGEGHSHSIALKHERRLKSKAVVQESILSGTSFLSESSILEKKEKADLLITAFTSATSTLYNNQKSLRYLISKGNIKFTRDCRHLTCVSELQLTFIWLNCKNTMKQNFRFSFPGFVTGLNCLIKKVTRFEKRICSSALLWSHFLLTSKNAQMSSSTTFEG